ncbi:uncharacterized protein LOC126902032 [Daktulosphaira vitifoliae]|uniref:uncharacterized protein LOC126902032 n=1 Tax=Daktulosphaira vitifoliae TaxID=58002 RepID=UPI0021A9B61F|nr:uncharacterized protein LOC126902032 [Daktulosphaira vitifoliae]
MDDYLGGTDTIESAVQLCDDLICIFQRAGMSLCKWLSNKNTVVDDMVENKNNERAFESTITKILGLTWDPANDMFIFKINLNIYSECDLTKRKILSEVASIYDPLGLLGPVIIRAKLFIQSLWNIKLAWDEVLTNNIKIHGFSEASEKAYGGCIYLRCTDIDGKHRVRLICGKSKVAPLKVISIPRLELCAALLLARLSYNVMEQLKFNIIKKYFWTNSNIALAWISSPSTNWKTFVAHRVGEIQNLSCPSEWAHVRSQDNPADLLSRGCEAKLLNEMQLWWQGPSWLSKDKTEWPSQNNGVLEISSNMLERKSTTKFIGNVIEEANLLDKFSSLNKILRIMAYCLRFIDIKVHKKLFKTSVINPDELNRANINLIRIVQNNYFAKEISCLINGKEVSKKSKLLRLRPFLDDKHLIRVGGRLKNALSIDECQRHHIVLPGDKFHIELVSDLSTKSFLNALDRFFNRRGIAKILYSDNATNFVGANKYLKEVYDLFQFEEHKNQLIKQVAEKGVEWRFIPARSPHFGGLWESAVKSMKTLILKVLGEAFLTYEELNTILIRAEA